MLKVSQLDPNATFTCFSCAAENCTEPLSTKSSPKILCQTGDICWVCWKFPLKLIGFFCLKFKFDLFFSFLKRGLSGKANYRGCASRQCIPRITYDNVIISSNICCGKDYCNTAMSINSNLILILLFAISVLYILNS